MLQPTHMFLERTFDAPLTLEQMRDSARHTAWCLDLYQVTWHCSFLALGGLRMLCWFSAADAESTRMALRKINVDDRVLWAGTVHEANESVTPNVLVERRFDAPVALGHIQALEDARAECLEAHRVKFACTFFSLERKRMLCLYAAPDAESVRIAQREAGMPFETAWAFERIDPSMM